MTDEWEDPDDQAWSALTEANIDAVVRPDGSPRMLVTPGEVVCIACELSGTWEGCSYHREKRVSSAARGLMQVVPSTLAAYQPPTDNLTAAIRYAATRITTFGYAAADCSRTLAGLAAIPAGIIWDASHGDLRQYRIELRRERRARRRELRRRTRQVARSRR